MNEKRQPIYRQIVAEQLEKAELDEFLKKELEDSGFDHVEVISSAVKERILVFAERPGVVIGRHGRTSKRLAEIISKRFSMENPYVEAIPVKNSYLSSRIVANKIKRRILLGYNPRRVGYFTMRNVMDAGALGVEIIISGKFGGERARSLRFRDGVMMKTGTTTQYVNEAVEHVLLKQGMMGVKVRILLPDIRKPDELRVREDRAKELLKERVKELAAS